MSAAGITLAVAGLLKALVTAARDGLLVWLGRRSAQADQSEAKADALDKQAEAAANSPDSVPELVDRLRGGERL